jgi:hypothetical protein
MDNSRSMTESRDTDQVFLSDSVAASSARYSVGARRALKFNLRFGMYYSRLLSLASHLRNRIGQRRRMGEGTVVVILMDFC